MERALPIRVIHQATVLAVGFLLGAAWVSMGYGAGAPAGTAAAGVPAATAPAASEPASGGARGQAAAAPALKLAGSGYNGYFLPVSAYEGETSVMKVVVSASGGLAADEVALSIEGLPPGSRAEFDPPVLRLPADGQAQARLTVFGTEEPFRGYEGDPPGNLTFPVVIRAKAGETTAELKLDLMLLHH